MNYYEYKNHKIYVCYLTLQNVNNRRKLNVLQSIKNNPKINIIYGIDAHDNNLIRQLITKLNIKLLRNNLQSNDYSCYGKLGRWLSTILVCKLCIDLDINIILIEDDLVIPPNFNFKFNNYFSLNSKIVKLGEWGDGYLLNPNSSRHFIESLIKEGIYKNDDNFIIDNLKCNSYSLLPRTKYGDTYNKIIQQKSLKIMSMLKDPNKNPEFVRERFLISSLSQGNRIRPIDFININVDNPNYLLTNILYTKLVPNFDLYNQINSKELLELSC